MNYQDFVEAMSPIVLNAAAIILTALIGFLVTQIKVWIDANVQLKTLEKIKKVCDSVVWFLDQVGLDRMMDNPAKKAWAINTVTKLLKNMGIFLSNEEADVYIEASYGQLKSGNLADNIYIGEAIGEITG